MMKHEFEALAGYEVNVHVYDEFIEPMYMKTDLSKADFVRMISRELVEKLNAYYGEVHTALVTVALRHTARGLESRWTTCIGEVFRRDEEGRITAIRLTKDIGRGLLEDITAFVDEDGNGEMNECDAHSVEKESRPVEIIDRDGVIKMMQAA